MLEVAAQDHLRTLDVDCRAAIELVHAVGPRLVARGRGGGVLLSSLAAFQGTPRVASYAATRAFTLVLGEGLTEELGPRGRGTSWWSRRARRLSRPTSPSPPRMTPAP